MALNKKTFIYFSFLSLVLVLLGFMIFSVILGTADISSREVLKIISEKLFSINFQIDESKSFIVLNLRMPRIILAILVGASLSLSGCILQAIFKNPMADPYITGTSAGALFGASLAMLLFANSNVSLALASFLGSLFSTFIIYSFSSKNGQISITTMLLAGLVLSSLLGAVVQFIMIFSKKELINIFTFTMGSFSGATWEAVSIIATILVISFIYYYLHYKELNIICLGDDNAKAIGVNADKTKKTFLVISALLTSVTVAFSGIIGFVGLIIPHFFRLILGNNHKYLLPFSLVGGAILMLFCDNIARTSLPSGEFPVGIVTSIIGAPLFLVLLRKSKRLI